MAFRLRHAVFQPVIEHHTVRQARQGIMEGGMASRLFLFCHRGQLMLQQVPLPDLIFQCQIDDRQLVGRSPALWFQRLHFFRERVRHRAAGHDVRVPV